MSDTVKSWIEERRAALAHVLKHPHPDPAAEWAQTALNALNKVLELADELDSGAEGYHDGVANEMRANAWRIRTHVQQAIEGAING